MSAGSGPIREGDRGGRVAALQRALVTAGYPLPRWGVDAIYGGETDEACGQLARDHRRRKMPRECSPALEELALDLVDAASQPPACIRDMRGTHPGRRLRRRRWSDITGITLHQTATRLLPEEATDRRRIDRAASRACKIAVHHVVLRNGLSVWSHDYTDVVGQAQRVFNASDVGVEIDGWFAGVEGDDSTFWRPRSQPQRRPMGASPLQIGAVKATLRWIAAEVARHGGEIRFIHAHRQTSSSRTSDPGQLIWEQVAIPIMDELGIGYGGPEFFVPDREHRMGDVWTSSGPGRPIPREWDPTATYDYRDTPTRPEPQTDAPR